MRERNKGFGMPSSIGSYQPPPQPIQESSSRLLNSQALDPQHHHHHLLLHQDLELQQQEAQRVGRDQNPDPDPAQLTNSATINLTSVAQTSPPQRPPPLTASATSSAAVTTVRYRECQKNHAASMGSHVVDGCGEFMPNGEEGTAEALKCAACECHRNFHRREIEGESPQPPPNSYYTQNPTRNSTRRTRVHPTQAPPPPSTATPTQQQKYLQGFAAFANSPSMGPMPPIMMAFGGTSGAPAESSSEDLNVFRTNAGGVTIGGQQSKKRFRTKFSQEQKDRMQELAGKLGWKIQKQDEQEVQQFCSANGVKRQVFKVWMHNNKQAMKKKQL